jgi:hypothetical protein
VNGSFTVDAGMADPIPTYVEHSGQVDVVDADFDGYYLDLAGGPLSLWDNGGRTLLTFFPGAVVEFNPEDAPHLGRCNSCFFVSTGNDIVLSHSVSNGSLVSPDGTVYTIPKGYSDVLRVSHPVSGWWKLKDIVGKVELMNPNATCFLQ